MASYAPAILKRFRAENSAALRASLLRKFPKLEAFARREPTWQVPSQYRQNGRDAASAAQLASRDAAFAKEDQYGLNMYLLQVESEVDRHTSQLRLVTHGIDTYGNVIRAEFCDFMPYFYCTFPVTWGLSPKQVNDEWCKKMREAMEKAARSIMDSERFLKDMCTRLAKRYCDDTSRLITDVNLEWHIHGFGFYADKPMPVLRVECVHWKLVPILRRVCENPFGQPPQEAAHGDDYVQAYKRVPLCDWVQKYCPDLFKPELFTGDQRRTKNMYTCEADVDYTLRFQMDKGIACGGWIRLWGASMSRSTQCFNVDACYLVNHNNVTKIPPHHELHNVIPDDNVFLYDLEVVTADGSKRFRRAERGDPIIQNGIQIMKLKAFVQNKTLTQAHRDGELFSAVISTKPIPWFRTTCRNGENVYDVYAINCKTELDLIVASEEIMLCVNPSYYIAYNGNSFDWPYLIRRARMLRSSMNTERARDGKLFDPAVNSYFCVGRDFRRGHGISHRKAGVRGRSSAASAKKDTDKVFISGCLNLDMLEFMRKMGRSGNASLDAVSTDYLNGVSKLAMDHDQMANMFFNDTQRVYVARYCIRDVELMTRLALCFNMFTYLSDLGKLTLISAQKLLDRGSTYMTRGLWGAQDASKDIGVLYPNKEIWAVVNEEFDKVMNGEMDNSRIQRERPHLILPTGAWAVKDVEGPRTIKPGTKYGGAVMVEPVYGLLRFVSVFDFKSLYPSIMRTYNLGPTTMICFQCRGEVIERVYYICRKANADTTKLVWTRTDEWYCTGEKVDTMQSVEEAIEMFESDECIYDEEVRETLRADYDFVKNPENKELVDKWAPLAFSRPPNITDEESAALSEADKVDVFNKVVQPICRLTGRTKTCTRRKDMPQFIQKKFREGLYAHVERILGDKRNAVKGQMKAVDAEVETLRHRGIAESDSRVKNLQLKHRQLNVTQLAIKVIMNGIYGVLDAGHKAKLLAETVTNAGKYLIEETVNILETIIHPRMGFLNRMIAVYGDTDSAFGKVLDYKYEKASESLLRKVRRWPKVENRGSYAYMYAVRMKALNTQLERAIEHKQMEERDAVKAKAFIAWKRLLHDCLDDTDRPKSPFHIPSAMQTDDYEPLQVTPAEREFFEFLMRVYDRVLQKCINTSDVLRKIPECCHLTRAVKGTKVPPLPSGNDILAPRDIHDALQWIMIQDFAEESNRIASLLNRFYEQKYQGCIIQEFEKMYVLLALLRKKMYAGNTYMLGSDGTKVSVAGLTAARGDSDLLKSQSCMKMIGIVVEEGNLDSVEEYALNTLRRIARREVKVQNLIASKGVKRDVTEYGERQPCGWKTLAITKGMEVHIAAGILRHLVHDEDLPLVDSRYQFLIAECEDTSGKKINKHKKKSNVPLFYRAIPPEAALHNYGKIRYDVNYYLDSMSNLIANILGPLFDDRSLADRHEIAESFRRIHDKEERQKAVKKHYDQLNKNTKERIWKFRKSFARSRVPVERLCRILRTDEWTPKMIRDGNGAVLSRDNNTMIRYEDDEEKELSDAQLNELDAFASHMNDNGVNSAVIAYEPLPDLSEQRGQKRQREIGIEKKKKDEEKRRTKRLENGHTLSSDALKQKSILSMFETPQEERACKECGKRSKDIVSYCLDCTVKVTQRREKQEWKTLEHQYNEAIRKMRGKRSITRHLKKDTFQCLSCVDTFSNEPFCKSCLEDGSARNTLNAFDRHVAGDIVEEANICSITCGVDQSPLSVDRDDIVDIEDAAKVSDKFFDENPGPATCVNTKCIVWERARTTLRRRALDRLRRRYGDRMHGKAASSSTARRSDDERSGKHVNDVVNRMDDMNLSDGAASCSDDSSDDEEGMWDAV